MGVGKVDDEVRQGLLFMPNIEHVRRTASLDIASVMFMFIIWKTDKRIGTVPCSQISTSVRVSGMVS